MTRPWKKCVRCGDERPLSAVYFYEERSNRDGFRNTCKRCHRATVRESQKNKARGICPTCKQPKPSDGL